MAAPNLPAGFDLTDPDVGGSLRPLHWRVDYR